MTGSEFRLVRAARNMLLVEGEQKGQKGQKEAKSLFLPLLALFVLFASITDLQTYAQNGGAQQSGAENRRAAAQNEDENTPADRITIRQLKRMMDAKEDFVIVDNRDGSSYVGSTVKIKGAIHITLNELEAKLKDLPKNKLIVTYCTWPHEGTSAGAASTLRVHGFRKVKALIGGFDAWEKAGYPIEPKETK